MQWLHRYWIRKAAKQYARQLGPHLSRSYGAAGYYSAGQIRASVAKLRLPARYIALGYAAFLPEKDYAAVSGELPFFIAYHEAYELFSRFRPHGLFSASGNPEISTNVTAAGYPGDGSSLS